MNVWFACVFKLSFSGISAYTDVLCPKHGFQHKTQTFCLVEVNLYKEKSMKFQSRVIECP